MTKAIDDRRLRLGLLAASVVMVLVSVAVLASRGGGDDGGAPQNRAARIVPRTALVYAHISSDRDRTSVNEALKTLAGFPGAKRVRDGLLNRFGGTPTGTDAADISEWLGKEAALAILPGAGERSDIMIALESRDRDKTDRYLRLRLGQPAGTIKVRGTALNRYGGIWVAWVGDFLTLGSFQALSDAVNLHAGTGVSLAQSEAYRRVSSGLPDNRVADAYALPAGLRSVLVPRGGLLGFLASLADREALVALGASLSPRDGDAQVTLKALTAVGAPRVAQFDPQLLAAVPGDSIAVIDTGAPARLLPRVLAVTGGLGDGLRRLQSDLAKRSGVNLTKEILPLLGSETVLSVRREVLAPVFTLVARVRDENAARERLARLQGPLSRLATRRPGGGKVPAFRTRRVGGLEAFELEVRPGLRIAYTVYRGRLIVSTSLTGILAAVRTPRPITRSDAFRKVLGGRPTPLSSLLFLDFSQLLGLGEQSGLADDPGYARSRADLRRIRAIGAATSAEGNITTAELYLEIS